jgi:hypothetical protein
MGNTNHSVRTPPAITMTTQNLGTLDLNGTTQSALLASPVGLTAHVTTGVSGTYSWTFTGPYTIDFSSPDGTYKSVFWTLPGTYTATVNYAGTGFNVSASVTVNVIVPTLTGFSGSSVGNVVDRGRNCSLIFSGQYLPYGATYTLGCYQNQQDTGMTWSATAMIPNNTYISDLGDAGIEFRQIVSVYYQRMNNGRLECKTARLPQSDRETGWQLDGSDPFQSGAHPIPSFHDGMTIRADEFDAPGSPLDGRQDSDGSPFQIDALFIDHRFETYVLYYTGTPGQPSFTLPLHIADSNCRADQFTCGIDRLSWTVGGKVNLDSSVPSVLYRERLATSTIGNVPLARDTTARSYTGRAQLNAWGLCPGAPDTHNPIDGSRYFVNQQYIDFFPYPPDQGGWDFWTSQITQCGVVNIDTYCMYGSRTSGAYHGKRTDVAKAFFDAAPFQQTDSAMANPPGSPGFNPAVYNPAFVRHCYLSFLQTTNPDQGGFDFWVNNLNANGDYLGVIDAFVSGDQYRLRFGAISPHY